MYECSLLNNLLSSKVKKLGNGIYNGLLKRHQYVKIGSAFLKVYLNLKLKINRCIFLNSVLLQGAA